MDEWASNVTYNAGDAVTRAGVGWTSLQNANLNHRPEESIFWWLLAGPREQVLSALRAILATGLGVEVRRNSPEPVDLVELSKVVVQVDGEEEKPEKEPETGVVVHTTGVSIECYVSTPDQDPGPAVNDLVERVRMVVLQERILGPDGRPLDTAVLGSLLYGKVEVGYLHPQFDGLDEGKMPVEIYRVAGSEHGGLGTVEFTLKYGVLPNNPWVLLRPGDGDVRF